MKNEESQKTHSEVFHNKQSVSEHYFRDENNVNGGITTWIAFSVVFEISLLSLILYKIIIFSLKICIVHETIYN